MLAFPNNWKKKRNDFAFIEQNWIQVKPPTLWGRVAEWLGRRNWSPEVAGASPILITKLELFLGRPKFNYSDMLANSKMRGLCRQLGFLILLCLSEIFLFLKFKWHALEQAIIAVHIDHYT